MSTLVEFEFAGHNRLMQIPSLESILTERYGVSLLAASPVTVLWAAERLAVELGSMGAAYKQLAAANRKREKQGIIPAYPEYGTKIFDAWMNDRLGRTA